MFDKQKFLNNYFEEEVFRNSGFDWEILQDIYYDYKENYYLFYENEVNELKKEIMREAPDCIRAVYGRAKDAEHLIEKIVRKAGKQNKSKYRKINKENYRDILSDLVGIRILILTKEEWKEVDTHLRKRYSENFHEKPVGYQCYGDKIIYDGKLVREEYTNKGYRSLHYDMNFEQYNAEIQVRTLAEEVYGEFDHRARYPYHVDNNFLKRYSKIVSKHTAELDDLVSMCFDMGTEITDKADKHFDKDSYREWTPRLVLPKAVQPENSGKKCATIEDEINKILLRKEV